MKIDTSHPKAKTGKFTSNDLKYFHLLEEDDLFEHIIYHIRSLSSLPKDGIDWDDQKQMKLLNKNGNWIVLLKETVKILSLYNLPSRWINSILSLIIFDVVVPPDNQNNYSSPIEIVHDVSSIGIKQVKIIVREKMSKEQIKQYLDKNREELDKALSLLPGTPDLNKMTNIKLGKTIIKLKKQNKKMPDEQIATELNKLFPDNAEHNPLEYNDVRILRKRFDEYMGRHIRKNKPDRLKTLIQTLS